MELTRSNSTIDAMGDAIDTAIAPRVIYDAPDLARESVFRCLLSVRERAWSLTLMKLLALATNRGEAAVGLATIRLVLHH